MKKTNKVLSLLLSLCIAMTMCAGLGTAASAAGREAKWSTDGASWIEGSFIDGITALNAASGGSLTLLSRVEVNAGASLSGGTYHLNLDGFDLTAAKKINTLTVTGANTELTISGSGSLIGGARGTSTSEDQGRAIVSADAKLKIRDSVSIIGGSGDYAGASAIDATNGSVTVSDSALIQAGASGVLGGGYAILGTNAEISISGSPRILGSIDQHSIFASGGSITISGTPTISGGPHQNAVQSVGLYLDGANADISGGAFSGDDCGLFVQGNSVVQLSGGSFSGSLDSVVIYERVSFTLADLLKKGYGFYYEDGSAPSLSGKTIQKAVTVKRAVETQAAAITADVTIPAPAYTVTIPERVDMGTLIRKMDGAADKIASRDLPITVSKVQNLFGEKRIVVSASTPDGTFALTDGTNQLAYSLFAPEASSPLTNDGVFATFTGDESKTGRVEVDQSAIRRAGTFTGTVVFTIALEDIA